MTDRVLDRNGGAGESKTRLPSAGISAAGRQVCKWTGRGCETERGARKPHSVGPGLCKGGGAVTREGEEQARGAEDAGSLAVDTHARLVCQAHPRGAVLCAGWELGRGF